MLARDAHAPRRGARDRPRRSRRATCWRAASEDWDRAVALGEQHGYRNAQATVLAPTGTIGLLMDCDTTGVEPDFALVKFKKLAGGGYFKIVNQSVPAALAAPRLRPTPRSSASSRYVDRHRHARGRAARQPRDAARARGLTRRRDRRASRRRCPACSTSRLAFAPWHARRRDAHAGSGVSAGRAREARLQRCCRSSASPTTQIDEANDVDLRPHDGRGRARPAARAPAGVRLRQPLRPARHALHRADGPRAA